MYNKTPMFDCGGLDMQKILVIEDVTILRDELVLLLKTRGTKRKP